MAVRPYDQARDDLHPVEHVHEIPSFAKCPNPYCKGGWVERGDNESGGAPAFQCRHKNCPYDQARDDVEVIEHIDEFPSFDEQLRDGMGKHAARLAVAVDLLLEPSSSDDAMNIARAAIARQTLDDYEAWFAALKSAVEEQWQARFGGRNGG
jgi:hypothetical protein